MSIIGEAFEEFDNYINNREYIEINNPIKPFDSNYTEIINYIQLNKIHYKNEIEKIFNEYNELYFKVILSTNLYYRYDFISKSYIIDERRNLTDYIRNIPITINVIKDNKEIFKIKIKPYDSFKNYITDNGWELVHDTSKPQLYKKIFNVDGYKIERKYINDCPRIPIYLIQDQKPFNDYGDKYKKFIYDYLEMIKYCLCSNNETDYEYIKNWLINKALLIRNATAIILQSPAQGIGKSTFANFLKSYFGDNSDLIEISSHYTWLTERFNSNLKNKILMSVEELPRSTTSSWITSFDKLKDFITNRTLKIECKGKDCIDCPNDIDFIITTNNYNSVPLETDNRRYFIPNVISLKDKKTEDLCRSVNSVLMDMGKGTERDEYFRCFYAYCKENYNKDFDPLNIPITSTIAVNNDQKMNLLFKYIKIFCLKDKKYLIESKNNKFYFQIVISHLCKDVDEFVREIDNNKYKLEEYNYNQKCVNDFKTSLHNSSHTITSRYIVNILKTLFNDECFGRATTKKDKGNTCFIISYDDLLEKYKEKGYVDDVEYNQLKGNYKINEINNNEVLNSNPEDIEEFKSTINNLKQDLESKDKIIKELLEKQELLKQELEKQRLEKQELLNKEYNKLKDINKQLETKHKETLNNNALLKGIIEKHDDIYYKMIIPYLHETKKGEKFLKDVNLQWMQQSETIRQQTYINNPDNVENSPTLKELNNILNKNKTKENLKQQLDNNNINNINNSPVEDSALLIKSSVEVPDLF